MSSVVVHAIPSQPLTVNASKNWSKALHLVQDPGPWNAAECIAAIRLLNAVSADHIETEATQVRLSYPWAPADGQIAVHTAV